MYRTYLQKIDFFQSAAVNCRWTCIHHVYTARNLCWCVYYVITVTYRNCDSFQPNTNHFHSGSVPDSWLEFKAKINVIFANNRFLYWQTWTIYWQRKQLNIHGWHLSNFVCCFTKKYKSLFALSPSILRTIDKGLL